MSYTPRKCNGKNSTFLRRRVARAQSCADALDFIQTILHTRQVETTGSLQQRPSVARLLQRLQRSAIRPSMNKFVTALPLCILQDAALFDEAVALYLRTFHPAFTDPWEEGTFRLTQSSNDLRITGIPEALRYFQPFLMLCVAVAQEQQRLCISAKDVLDHLRKQNSLTSNMRESAFQLTKKYLHPYARLSADELFCIISSNENQKEETSNNVVTAVGAQTHVVASIMQTDLCDQTKSALMQIANSLHATSILHLYELLSERFSENDALLAFLTAEGVISQPYPGEWLTIRQKLSVSIAS